MPAVRVFLLTCRRPALLRRALNSLLRQTMTDWVCELHNDAPEDDTPRRLVAELADPRIELRQHERNWGAVTAMRHAYAGGPEPFASLLEDDNWWEPNFLAAATAALAGCPDAALAWANMRISREESDHSWTDTGDVIWDDTAAGTGPREYHWPEIYQAFDALHSHGAAVFRPSRFIPIPAATPLSIIEPVRERAALGPLLFLSMPLAHFAVTRVTARSSDRVGWLQSKLLLSCSFFTRHPPEPALLAALWRVRRAQRPRDTAILFFTAIALRRWNLLEGAVAADWVAFLRGVVRHPLTALRGLRFRREHAATWAWLLAHPLLDRGDSPRVRATVFAKRSDPIA